MKFEDRVYSFISERQLIASADRVLLGVSGGADSVCLFRVILSLCEKVHLCQGLTVVHVNHMIRGSEADDDQKFVEKLCELYGVKCYSYRRDIPAISKKLGISEEEAGRQVRYEIFDEVASLEKCTKIAVAHHKNDLAETVLFNMVRGSGISGLSGISSVRGNIIRPLLCVSRQEIEAYLKELEQPFRTDSTNNVLDYTRNKIRHTVIPALEELNTEAVEHIAALALDAESIDRFVENEAEKLFNQAKLKFSGNSLKKNTCICLDIPTLEQADTAVLYKLIHNALIKAAGKKKDITRQHIKDVAALIFNDTGKQVMLPYDMLARRSYDKLIIKADIKSGVLDIEDVEIEDIEIDLDEVERDCIKYIDWRLSGVSARFELKLIEPSMLDKSLMEKNIYTKIFSYDKILAKKATRFCIRTKNEGDYIVIAPDGRTKKLNRLFIDAKTDREDREILPLLALDDEILWAVGLRYNEAYRVTEDTKRLLVVTYLFTL